jgi:hypothetical protein
MELARLLPLSLASSDTPPKVVGGYENAIIDEHY